MNTLLTIRSAIPPLLLITISWAGAIAAEKSRSVNVVCIVVDDLNAHIGCYGQSTVKTSNIDRLAARGVRFDRAYCQYPLCNPSRTSFLTGLRPETTRVLNNYTRLADEAESFTHYFARHGYATKTFGKVAHTGFDGAKPEPSTVVRRVQIPGLEYVGRKNNLLCEAFLASDATTTDGATARAAVEWLEEVSLRKKPFFLAAGFHRPHIPYSVPRRYFDLYSAEEILLPREPLEHLQSIPRVALPCKLEGEPMSEEQWQAAKAAYYACITFMDAQVGIVLDGIDRLQFWENTVVILFSDHGYHLGEHGGQWHKMSLFEESAKVPLIVVAPEKERGVASPRLVELVDIYPTLIELCGLPSREELEGTSFVPLLKRPSEPWKTAAFTVVTPDISREAKSTLMGRSVRTERYHYSEWGDSGTAVLYDHQTDPHEYNNLINDPGHTQVLARMRETLGSGWKAALPSFGTSSRN